MELVEQKVSEQLIISISPTGFYVGEGVNEQILPNHAVENGFNIPHRLIFHIAGNHFRIDGVEYGRSNQKITGHLINTGKNRFGKIGQSLSVQGNGQPVINKFNLLRLGNVA